MSSYRGAVMLALVLHVALLLWSNWVHSPAMDEVAHLPAGISHWQFQDFSLYCVNPPLVKMIAAAPVVAMNPRTDWSSFRSGPGVRSEFDVGRDFARVNKPRLRTLFFAARCALIPFSLLGAIGCLLFARYLFGPQAGFMSLWLWCLSPSILANASMITPDVPATSCGLCATYCFTRSLGWRSEPRPASGWYAAAAGMLGIAILCKLTNLILIPAWAFLLLIQQMTANGRGPRFRRLCRGCLWFALQMVFALHVVNLGYACQGVGTPLRDYQFVSASLRFDEPVAGAGSADVDLLSAAIAKSKTEVHGAPGSTAERKTLLGRVAQTWLGAVPLPLPSPMLTGIDLQKRDFERGMWSYLAGEHRLGGWWYYYVVAALLKVPLGTWLCVVLGSLAAWNAANLKVAAPVLLPAAAILGLISSQTGFSRYLRYLLPAFPYVFVFASQAVVFWNSRSHGGSVGSQDTRHQGALKAGSIVAASAGREVAWFREPGRVARGSLLLAVVWTTAVSLRAAPHWLSYFNELAGGPRWGHELLIDANIDWGQDLYFLREWSDQHPEARPLYVETHGMLNPLLAGIPSSGRPPALRLAGAETNPSAGSNPGWVAVSVHQIRDRRGRYAPLLSREPTAIVGQSIYVFDLTREHEQPQATRIVSAGKLRGTTDGFQAADDGASQESGVWNPPSLSESVRSPVLRVFRFLFNHVSPRKGQTHANESP